MSEQRARAQRFRDLHAVPFVIPNPWDAGSARILAAYGFPALATTSAGLAYGLRRRDGAGQLAREEVLANVAEIVAATPLPVSADLERCYADTAEGIGETIRAAAALGVVGGSIEDATGDPSNPIYPFEQALDRVRAAISAAGELDFPFTLTARAENFLYGRQDLADTIRRLNAFAEAGADVLYAPALPDLASIATLCAAVPRPVNALASPAFSVADLAEAGVRRISLGSALARAALGALQAAAGEIREAGTFGFAAAAVPYPAANAIFAEGSGS